MVLSKKRQGKFLKNLTRISTNGKLLLKTPEQGTHLIHHFILPYFINNSVVLKFVMSLLCDFLHSGCIYVSPLQSKYNCQFVSLKSSCHGNVLEGCNTLGLSAGLSPHFIRYCWPYRTCQFYILGWSVGLRCQELCVKITNQPAASLS